MRPDESWASFVTADSGYITYQLTIHLHKAKQITIGRLGQYRLPAGYYIYTGSARTNIISRVKRHLSKNKKLHWHIDYLLVDKGAQVVDISFSSKTECECNQGCNGTILVEGFGASDCRSKCGSHLKYLEEASEINI